MTEQVEYKPILTITGPTGSGKTSLALKLAEKFPLEIISADSRQIYRLMNIGTAKPSEEELFSLVHHLIDIRNPDEKFDAGQFVNEVTRLVPQIVKRGKIPVIAGGTGMYIWALEQGLFEAGQIPSRIREKFRKLKHENNLLHQMLRAVDPEMAELLHPNDLQRISRALEIFEFTGKPMSVWKKNHTQKQFPYALEIFILNPSREKLYNKINDRVESMMDAGLIDEVRQLVTMGYSLENNSLRSVGYQEVIPYLEGETDLETMINEIKKNSRRYAKRQLTWLRKQSATWLDVNSPQDLADAIFQIESFLKKNW